MTSDSIAAAATERHYTLRQIAELWKISLDTARRLFQDREGVLKIRHPQQPGKRTRTLLRIPQSTLDRLYQERSGGFGREIQSRRRGVKE